MLATKRNTKELTQSHVPASTENIDTYFHSSLMPKPSWILCILKYATITHIITWTKRAHKITIKCQEFEVSNARTTEVPCRKTISRHFSGSPRGSGYFNTLRGCRKTSRLCESANTCVRNLSTDKVSLVHFELFRYVTLCSFEKHTHTHWKREGARFLSSSVFSLQVVWCIAHDSA